MNNVRANAGVWKFIQENNYPVFPVFLLFEKVFYKLIGPCCQAKSLISVICRNDDNWYTLVLLISFELLAIIAAIRFI